MWKCIVAFFQLVGALTDVEVGGLLQVKQPADSFFGDNFNPNHVEQILHIADAMGKTLIQQVDKNPSKKQFLKLLGKDEEWLQEKIDEVMQDGWLKDKVAGHVKDIKQKMVYHLLSWAMEKPAVKDAVLNWAPDFVCKLVADLAGPSLMQIPQVLAEDAVFQQVQAKLKVNTSRDLDDLKDLVKPEHLSQVLHIAEELGKTINKQVQTKPGGKTLKKMLNKDGKGWLKDQVTNIIQQGWLKDNIGLLADPVKAVAVISTKILAKAVMDPALQGGILQVLNDYKWDLIWNGGGRVFGCLLELR